MVDRALNSTHKASREFLAFGGERHDAFSNAYHLGNGYRAYSPALMRFRCPDSLSPFEAGGINPYAYCAGDPINRLDPSGHLSWQAWMGIGLGVVGLGLAAFTAGASIAAAGGVIAAIESASAVGLAVGGAGVVADVAAIASGAVEEVDPKASAALGWVALGAGAVGLASGALSAAAFFTKGTRLRLGQIRSVGLSGRGAVGASKGLRSDASTSVTSASRLSHFEALPPELKMEIFDYLPGSDLENLSLTSKELRARIRRYSSTERLQWRLNRRDPMARLKMFAAVLAGREPGAMRRQLNSIGYDFRIVVRKFSFPKRSKNEYMLNYDLWMYGEQVLTDQVGIFTPDEATQLWKAERITFAFR